MKKIYQGTERFLSAHYALNIFIFALITLISGLLAFYQPAHDFEVISFICSIYGGIRLATYKNGKIPIFMIDRTWNKMRIEHDEEEAEKLYREMSLKHCTVCYMIAVPSVVLAVVWEAVYLFLFA